LTAQPIRIHAQFPKAFEPLLGEKARYKVFHGGRVGCKSWQFARALLIRGLTGVRVLCTRETQSSIKESVKQLLADQIKLMGLEDYYRILDQEIRGPRGTLFIFKGLSDPEALKSAEGVDVCWIEEARIVTETSWKKLDPTIRKPGAEIWVSFNPELETDYLWQLFVSNEPPPNSIVRKVTYRDNPWITDDIRQQIAHMRETDYDEYLWVWEGHTRVALEGAIYAKELRATKSSGRICRVPHLPGKPVHTFWDLGRSDMTAIWFVQMFGLENRVIRYYQNNGEHISHYVDHLRALQEQHGYNYGTMWLPHDADEQRLSSRRTTRQQVEDAQFRVRIVPKVSIADGIQAARTIFPNCYFDQGDTVDGIAALGAYKYDVDDDGTRSKLPEHSWASHGSDAFRYMGVALRDEPVKVKAHPKPHVKVRPGPRAWMAR